MLGAFSISCCDVSISVCDVTGAAIVASLDWTGKVRIHVTLPVVNDVTVPTGIPCAS
jgi:hypothetical protein